MHGNLSSNEIGVNSRLQPVEKLLGAEHAAAVPADHLRFDGLETTRTTTLNPDGSTTTQVTTASGTISQLVPSTTFVMQETTGPVTYRYGKAVSYVTKGGKVVTADDVKSRVRVGAPVSVHYVMDGDTRVVRRIVIED